MIIIARALLSWVNPDPYNPIVRFLYNVTEPVLAWLRQRLPLVYSGLDLSPLLVLLAIVFLRSFLIGQSPGPGLPDLLRTSRGCPPGFRPPARATCCG